MRQPSAPLPNTLRRRDGGSQRRGLDTLRDEGTAAVSSMSSLPGSEFSTLALPSKTEAKPKTFVTSRRAGSERTLLGRKESWHRVRPGQFMQASRSDRCCTASEGYRSLLEHCWHGLWHQILTCSRSLSGQDRIDRLYLCFEDCRSRS